MIVKITVEMMIINDDQNDSQDNDEDFCRTYFMSDPEQPLST